MLNFSTSVYIPFSYFIHASKGKYRRESYGTKDCTADFFDPANVIRTNKMK